MTHTHIYYGKTISILYKIGETYFGKFFIFMEVEPFFYCFVIIKTLNLSIKT